MSRAPGVRTYRQHILRPRLREIGTVLTCLAASLGALILTNQSAGAALARNGEAPNAVRSADRPSALVPPDDPSANIPPQVPYDCNNATLDNSANCIASVLLDINYARSLEDVGPMILPLNYAEMTPSQQMLVIFNLERTARNLPPFEELSTTADADAMVGAVSSEDPPLASGIFSSGSGGIEDPGQGNALEADYAWMYTDGCYPYEGSADCASVGGSGGWGHRNNILGSYGCSFCGAIPVAGAAEAAATSGKYPGLLSWVAEFGNINGPIPNSDTSFLNSSVSYPSSASPYLVDESVTSASPDSSVTIQGIYLTGAIVGFGSTGCISTPTVTSDETIAVIVPPCASGTLYVDVTTPSGTSNTLPFTVSSPGVTTPTEDTSPYVGMASTPAGNGYWLAKADGTVSAFGSTVSYGDLSGETHTAPTVGIVATPDGKGYWLVASNGGVFTFGDAGFYGSMGGTHLNRPVVGMAATPDGKGYWLVASDGGIFSFGDAPFYGSTGAIHLNQPIVGIAADPATGGYWMVASDGGIFSFHAPFLGSMGGTKLNKPVVGMAVDPSTDGYWLVASDGGIFSFGAPFYGSTGAIVLNKPIVGMEAASSGGGYRFVASDGGIFDFGSSQFYGSGA
jgi:hypothetical protein